MHNRSSGAVRCKASIGHILLGFRARKLFCFSFCNSETTGPLEGCGLVPFSWSLCGEGRKCITFSREDLDAGISHPGSQPQPSAETCQVAVSAQTFIVLVFEIVTDRFQGLWMLWTGTCAWLGTACESQKLSCACRTRFNFGSC